MLEKEHISFQIKKLRISLNLSQNRFGKKLGLTGKAVSAYETGRSVPPLKILENISRTYNVSITADSSETTKCITSDMNEIEAALGRIKSAMERGLKL